MSNITGSSSKVGKDQTRQLDATSSSSSSVDDGLKKGPWTAEEDQKLVDYIKNHGHGRWRTLPKNAGLKRCGKSCRLRGTNYLRPDIKRGRFSYEEEEAIIHLHSILGNKWSSIAARLPGRTDNEIKNYWNTHIKKRLLRMGIDPVTHAPRLDLLKLSSIISSSLYNYTHCPSLPSLLGAMGSTSIDQDKDFQDLAKQLMISESIRQGTPPVSLIESLLANQLQNQDHNSVGGQYYSLPSSSWGVEHGRYNQNLNNLRAESSVHLGNNMTNLGMTHQSLIDPSYDSRYNTIGKEVVQTTLGASSALSSPLSNSGCTFNSSSTMTYATSGACHISEDDRDTYASSDGLMYHIMNNVSYVNSIM